MIRDPRDIVSSKHKKRPDRYWASLKFWKTYSKMMEKLKKHPRFITIRYERFVTHPDKIQQKICQNIPFLKKETPFSEYHLNANVSKASKNALGGVRPIRPTSVGKWKDHKERIAGQMKLHGDLTEDLVKYGYEKDASWKKFLNDVTPDISPSHFPEYFSFYRKRTLTLGKYLEAFRRIIEQMIGFRIRITHPKKWF